MQVYAPLNSEPAPILQQVEVASFFQLPSFQIIGLPAPEVAEAKERVRAAIEACGMEFPRKRIILNLSPASIRKKGTGLDLAMALSVLGLGIQENISIAAWGELGLDGSVKSSGQLTRTLYACWKGQLPYLILSKEDAVEAEKLLIHVQRGENWIGNPPLILGVNSLAEAWKCVTQINQKEIPISISSHRGSEGEVHQLKDDQPKNDQPKNVQKEEFVMPPLLKLSAALERVLGVASAGHHHLLLLGPRGAGKTHALEWFVAIQPEMSPHDWLRHKLISELSRNSGGDKEIHPIRRISSQVRPGALVGGASSIGIRPGEFSLAHGGVLIADELPEWSRDSRECLREPLERGVSTITRTQGAVELPAKFLFAANGNLCPCGGSTRHMSIGQVSNSPEFANLGVKCTCDESVRRAYLSRLSGPILDRIDLCVFVHQSPEVSYFDPKKDYLELKQKVMTVRSKLHQQWGKIPGYMSGHELELMTQNYEIISKEINSISFTSLRSRHKVLRLALSLAAWDGCEFPSKGHFAEATCYRPDLHF